MCPSEITICEIRSFRRVPNKGLAAGGNPPLFFSAIMSHARSHCLLAILLALELLMPLRTGLAQAVSTTLMGATVQGQGAARFVTFRVWAPNAKEVFLAGGARLPGLRVLRNGGSGVAQGDGVSAGPNVPESAEFAGGGV